MFSKEEIKNFRQDFWTAFGTIMKQKRSAGGYRVNWVNYRTGVKGVAIRLLCDTKNAFVCLDFDYPDDEIRELHWQQIEELKTMFSSIVADNWMWEPFFERENGQEVGRIYTRIDNVSIYKKETWPEAFAFMKKNLIPLEEFWCEFSELFKTLT